MTAKRSYEGVVRVVYAGRFSRAREARRRRSAWGFVLAALLLLLTAAMPPGVAAFQLEPTPGARADGRLRMSPASERIDAHAGREFTRIVKLHNQTGRAIVVDLQLGQVVGAGAEEIVEVRHGVREGAAAWARLERSRVRLPAATRAALQLTVRVPRRPPPGSHSLAVSATVQSTSEAGGGARPSFRVSSVFVLELPGTAKVAGRITSLRVRPRLVEQDQAPRLRLVYRNSGARLLRVDGKIRAHGWFGRDRTYKVEDLTVYPDGSNQIEVPLGGLGIGRWAVSVRTVADAAGLAPDRDDAGAVWVIPSWWRWALAALLVVAANVVVQRVLRARELRHAHDEPLDDPDTGDAHWDDEPE